MTDDPLVDFAAENVLCDGNGECSRMDNELSDVKQQLAAALERERVKDQWITEALLQRAASRKERS